MHSFGVAAAASLTEQARPSRLGCVATPQISSFSSCRLIIEKLHMVDSNDDVSCTQSHRLLQQYEIPWCSHGLHYLPWPLPGRRKYRAGTPDCARWAVPHSLMRSHYLPSFTFISHRIEIYLI